MLPWYHGSMAPRCHGYLGQAALRFCFVHPQCYCLRFSTLFCWSGGALAAPRDMFWPHRRTPCVTRAGISPGFSRGISRGGISQRAAHLARGSGGSDRGAEGISDFSAHGVLTPSPVAATLLRLCAGNASYLWEVNMEIRGSRMHFFKHPRILLRAAGRGGRRSSRDSFDVGDLAHNIFHAFKNCPTSAVQLARLRIPRSDFQTSADHANFPFPKGGGPCRC